MEWAESASRELGLTPVFHPKQTLDVWLSVQGAKLSFRFINSDRQFASRGFHAQGAGECIFSFEKRLVDASYPPVSTVLGVLAPSFLNAS